MTAVITSPPDSLAGFLAARTDLVLEAAASAFFAAPFLGCDDDATADLVRLAICLCLAGGALLVPHSIDGCCRCGDVVAAAAAGPVSAAFVGPHLASRSDRGLLLTASVPESASLCLSG